MTVRWWWVALGAVSFAAGRAWTEAGPDGHWVTRNGDDWRALSPAAQTAYTEGFLAGSAFGQAAAAAKDSAGLTQALAQLRHDGRFRLPYGANVYVSRINDYYWWENHRPLPLWYAFWEVNTSLTGPMTDSTR
ncbi:MAG TPA: hypothetical protein VIG08_00485 [Gemmatimonadales bacterium]